MPRILPRLLRALEEAPLASRQETTQRPVWRKRKSSLWKKPPAMLDWVGQGRTQSILADDLNPFTNRRKFRGHKTRPPQFGWCQKAESDGPADKDPPRRMSAQEAEWYASPYLRMLSGPLRRCFLTGQLLPRDLLIRLAPMRVPSPRSPQHLQHLILPSGLDHPRFRSRKASHGVYLVCRKDAIAQLAKHAWLFKRLGSNVNLHDHLAQQIGHLLRLRVLQELELLADRLKPEPKGADTHPLLERLTRAELTKIRTTGFIPYPRAVALLIVPPVNKDAETRNKPQPNYTHYPDEQQGRVFPPNPLKFKSPYPSSTLHLVSSTSPRDDDPISSSLPQVPLYNACTLFPSRLQRAALHKRLNNLLFVERRARRRLRNQSPRLGSCAGLHSNGEGESGQKASHAYLLCSDTKTLLRADAVPLAIALWRLRLWEGVSWSGKARDFWGWRVNIVSNT